MNLKDLFNKKSQKKDDFGRANPNVKRTWEIVNIEDVEPAGVSTATHDTYYCPFCETKRGPDHPSSGKLYFDREELVGLCFQCNTVVHDESTATDKTNHQFKQACTKLSKKLKVEPKESLNPINMNFPECDTDCLKYLHKRNPLIVPLIDHLGLRMWEGTNKGIVTPFVVDGYFVKFQVRFIGTRGKEVIVDGKKKKELYYYTSPGPKVLYSPFHTLSNYKLLIEKTITLCEGTYDAIALAIIGYPNPMAILGKTLTPLQISQIRKCLPDNMRIMMDEKSLGWEIYHSIKRKLPSVGNYHVDSFRNMDPEEHLVNTLPKNRASYVENVQMWRNGWEI